MARETLSMTLHYCESEKSAVICADRRGSLGFTGWGIGVSLGFAYSHFSARQ